VEGQGPRRPPRGPGDRRLGQDELTAAQRRGDRPSDRQRRRPRPPTSVPLHRAAGAAALTIGGLRSPGGGTGEAEADAAAAVRRRVLRAAGRATVPRAVVPRAAAQGAEVSVFCAFGIYCIIWIVLAVAVGAPLKNVAVHVVEVPRVGLEVAHGRREGVS